MGGREVGAGRGGWAGLKRKGKGDELKAAGFLEAMPPSGFDVPNPSDSLGPDEDPFDPNEPEDMATGNLNLDQA